jgi:hypothetical protein
MRSVLAAWTLPPPRRKAILAGAEVRIEGLIAAGYLSRFPNGSLYLADGGRLVLGAKMTARLEELEEVMRAKGEVLPAAPEKRSPAPRAEMKSRSPLEDYQAECIRLRAKVARLEEQLRADGRARPRVVRPKASSADPFTTPAKALAAWYAAAGPGAIHLPGWRKAVVSDHALLSPAAFRAAMVERVEGTRALARRSAEFLAARAAAIGQGSGLFYWHPGVRNYVKAPASGPARDVFEKEIREQYREARRLRIVGERHTAQRKRAEKRRIAKVTAEDAVMHPRYLPMDLRIHRALEESRAARESSRFQERKKRPLLTLCRPASEPEEPARICPLCRRPSSDPNEECPACWCRANPRPDDDPIYKEAETLVAARETRLADLARHKPVVVGLLSCGKAKQPGQHPARDLYTSPLFRTSLAYLESVCHEVYILSAKHGLLELDARVESYDARLPQRTEDLECWARNVEASLRLRFVKGQAMLPVQIVGMAGRNYLEPLQQKMDWVVAWTLPLDGMSIFQRQHWAATWRRAHPREA